MWERIFEYKITKQDIESGKTEVGKYIKSKGFSSTVIRHMKETPEGIQKNSVWARVYEPIEEGDILTLHLVEMESSENIVPMPLPMNIVYEDQDLLVINKPAGMPIHPSQGNYDNTLANACAYYFEQKGEPFTYRCINRLDRDTTGLLILARHAYSASLLSNMVAKREIHREYRAIVTGKLPETGVVEAPIARVDGSTIEREVNFENGEYARTNFKCLAYKDGYSLASLKLDTGRTHQIRVHMKYIGHPLPGDFLYNPDYSVITRQALHSYRLKFTHPITGEAMDFTAPLPEDMQIF